VRAALKINLPVNASGWLRVFSHSYLYPAVPFPSVAEVFSPEFGAWGCSTGVAAWTHAWQRCHAPAPIRTVGPPANAQVVILVWRRRPGAPPLL